MVTAGITRRKRKRPDAFGGTRPAHCTRISKSSSPQRGTQSTGVNRMDTPDTRSPVAEPLTVQQLCDAFIASRDLKRQMGQLSPYTLAGYADTCRWLTRVLGSGRVVE